MKGNLTNLTVNPCKMCMPMGAVTASYGIRKCMTLLHGSQGCSTYIRRHMATHYNEPVDIASSSLTEEGTVYGGEKNLIQGLLNLIQVYEPEVIAVATTCLAETIGEDISRIVEHFYQRYPEYSKITIIPIHTAGYSGTQFEGFLNALYQIVRTVPMNTAKNNMVNIVTSQLSPADTRYIKGLLESFGIEYILLPDLSDNLDGIYQPTYQRLPMGGTALDEISKMAGARLTIELSTFVSEGQSVGQYLYETYGVPYRRCNIPVGLRDTDAFLDLLAEISGKNLTPGLIRERGRYLDACIDAHKYCGEALAAVYGEPDFVYSMVRFCVENGIMPVITATGSSCKGLKELLTEEIECLADSYSIDHYEILDDTDFQTIEVLSRELGVNLYLGNSDGRRSAEKLGVKLIRRSFPVHDHLGGQRLRSLGYEGALTVLDEIANAMIDVKHGSFREKLYQQYYREEPTGGSIPENDSSEVQGMRKSEISPELAGHGGMKVSTKKRSITYEELQNSQKSADSLSFPALELPRSSSLEVSMEKSIEEKTAEHPCFNCSAHKYARMHLPIAPHCNISCNYCLRKFDCPNESRPGVTTSVLQPEEALQSFLEARAKLQNLSVVGIAGPGDALANFTNTKKTLELIREQDSQITFCLSTNGLLLPLYAMELIELGVTHVTVTMNAIDPKIGARIYKYVDYMGTKYEGETAAAILLANQLSGIRILTSHGVICKVNIVMLKGINDQHIPEVVEKAKELGVVMTNIMPLIPVKGSAFEHLEPLKDEELLTMRKRCGESLKQMYHCRQCRADAVGTLAQDNLKKAPSVPETMLQIAVATRSGIAVDQHFGQASEFYIYEYINGNVKLKEKRPVSRYCNGQEDCDNGEDKIGRMIQTISDCNAILALRIGDAPKSLLKEKGIQVFTDYDLIEDAIKKVFQGDCSQPYR